MWQASAIQDENSPNIIEEIPAPPIKYLVFEGGGVRGIAYAGVVQELEEADFLSQVEHVAGSSIGSIAALLVALGCTSDEINELLGSLCFEEYLEGQKPWSITPDLITKGKQCLTILTSHSLSSGDRFLAWIEKVIEKKLGNKNATFADLAKLIENSQVNNYKYLSVTGSNLSKNRIEIFNHETTPDMPIALAVRISASFPGVFRAVPLTNKEEVEVEINTPNGLVKEKIIEEVTNYYVDGGLMNNLPSFIFGDEKYLPEELGFTKKGANPSILNIKIDTDEEVRQVLWNSGQPKPVIGITDLSKKLLDGMQSRDTEIYQQYPTNTIQVYDCGIDTLKFNITDAEKKKLIVSGQEAAAEWLQTHVSEAYQIRVFKNQMEWLKSKKMEELVPIIKLYEQQLEKLLLDHAPPLHDNEPSIKNLKNKINWFYQYIHYRFTQLFKPNTIFNFTPHIDITPIKSREKWDEQIKLNMKNKLKKIETEIELLESKVKGVYNRIEILHGTHFHLHDLLTFDSLIYLTKLTERLKWLEDTKSDLFNKLNNRNAKNKSDYPASSANERVLFQAKVRSYLAKKDFYLSPHNNLMTFLERHLYEGKTSYLTEEGVEIFLDLRNLKDFKIYLMACYLYLKFINSNDSLMNDVSYVFRTLFPSENIPTNLYELGGQLNEKEVELLLSAYRIEGLIKNFMRVEKKTVKTPIDLDFIFTALSPSSPQKKLFTKKQKFEPEEPNDIELDLVYQPFSHERSDKFLMFHRQGSHNLGQSRSFENQSLQMNVKNPDGKKNEFPKCMRRLESN